MLVMVVFFIAFRWIHLSTPLIRLFLLVLILLLMPTLNFLPVWFALSLLRFRLRLKANQTGKKFRVGIKSNISTNRNNLISGVDRCIHLRSEERFSRNAETDLVCRLLPEKKKRYTNITTQ